MPGATVPRVARPAARRTLGYEPALDGVRAVAISLVVLWHAFTWPPGGFLGVHIFFVLSGFLITTLLVQEWDGNGSISLSHFYVRRALRLAPALAVLLVTYSAIQAARAALDPGALDLSTALRGVLASAFYVSNVVQASGLVLGVPVSHLWSLATEEQFYLLWPLLLLGALRLGMSRRAVGVLLAGMILLVALQRLELTLAGAERARLYFAPDTTFDAVLVGCLLGIAFTSGWLPSAPRPRRAWHGLLLLAAGFVTAAVLLVDIESRLFYGALLLPFAAAVALLLVALLAGSPLGGVLATPPFVFGGKISYSLYLWHPMVLWFGRKLFGLPPALGIVLSVLVATASYYAVERPFLRRKRRARAGVENATAWFPAEVAARR